MKGLPLALLVFVPVLLGLNQPFVPQNVLSGISETSGEVPLLIYFKSNNCSTCDPFDQLFEQLITRVRFEEHFNAVCLNIDQSEGQICAEIYDVTATPTLVIADRTGHVMFRSTTTLSEDEIKLILKTLPGTPTEVEVADHAGRPAKIVVSAPVENNKLIVAVRDESADDTPQMFVQNTGLVARANGQTPRLTATTDLSLGAQINLPPMRNPKLVFPGQTGIESDGQTAESTQPTSVQSTTEIAQPAEILPTQKVNSRKWQYAIQLGYFSTSPNAMKLIHKANSVGLPEVRSEDTDRDGQDFFRVLSGTYNTLQEAQAQLDSAISMGFKAAIYRW
jgi:hypothetical protein